VNTTSFPRLRILDAIAALTFAAASLGSVNAQTAPGAGAMFAQLAISPPAAQPSTVPAQLPPAPAQRPAAQRPAPSPARPPATPARPPATPARPTPPAAPAVAPAQPAPDPAKEERQQLLKQVADLRSEIAYLNVQTGNLTAQVSSLTSIVTDLQKQLAGTEQRLKGEMGRLAGTPVAGSAGEGAAGKSGDSFVTQFLRSPWSEVAVPMTLFLLLCALLGTMVIGVPVRALMYRVPRREVADAAGQTRTIHLREGIASRGDPR
jgi:hypothetical protein